MKTQNTENQAINTKLTNAIKSNFPQYPSIKAFKKENEVVDVYISNGFGTLEGFHEAVKEFASLYNTYDVEAIEFGFIKITPKK